MTTPNPADERARQCIKCGRQVGPDESMCEICNRAGMVAPSASQYHGTVVVAIVLAVVGLALAGSLSLRGVGPYAAEVRAVVPASEGYTVAFAVTNEGSSPGRAKCQLTALGPAGQQLRIRNTLTSQIPGTETVEVAETLANLAEAPADVRVTCS